MQPKLKSNHLCYGNIILCNPNSKNNHLCYGNIILCNPNQKKKYYLCYGKIIQCNKSFQYLFELHWFVMMRWWLCLTKPIIHQVQVIKKNITKPWAPEKLNNFILVCRLWGWFRNRITPNHPLLEGLVQTCMYYTCQSHIQWLFLFLLHHFSIDWLACSSVAIGVLQPSCLVQKSKLCWTV